MAKHTAGPWQVLAGSNGMIYTVGSPYGHGPMHIADARGWGHLTGTGACNLKSEDAAEIYDSNARLLSAAPDLLEACEIAEAGIMDWRLGRTHPDEIQGDLRHMTASDGYLRSVLNSLRAAIAKAEGR